MTDREQTFQSDPEVLVTALAATLRSLKEQRDALRAERDELLVLLRDAEVWISQDEREGVMDVYVPISNALARAACR